MSLRERIAAVAVFAVVVSAFLLVLGLRDGEPEATPSPDTLASSVAETSVTPAAHRFGERVTATIDVLVPKNQLQPGTITGTGSFDPYDVVSRKREILDAGDRWLVRFTIGLECVKLACVPEGRTGEFQFDDGSVRWRVPPPPGRRARDRRLDERNAAVVWEPVTIMRTLSPTELQDISWRSALAQLPEPGYRASPAGLANALLAAAVALVLAAATLVALWFRREHRVELAAAAAAREETRVSPLERALTLLGTNGDGDRRRVALETLAGELRREGEHELAHTAETLAWSPDEPDERRVDELAVAVREAGAPA